MRYSIPFQAFVLIVCLGKLVLAQSSENIEQLSSVRSVETVNESAADEKEETISSQVDLANPSGHAESSSSAGKLVEKIRPAVVLVRTPSGHGTGCVVHPEGWLITNYHVIHDAPRDPDSGAQIVRVYFGGNAEAGFELISEPVWAKVFKTSRRADLALLKCETLPAGTASLFALSLAEQPPSEGSDCLAIGMPAASVLWSVRRGTVAGHGTFPQDIQGRIRLGASEGVEEKRRKELLQLLAPEGERKVTISTCGINQGDSGGPLIDQSGNLAAITYAVPAVLAYKEFGYHIHLSELQEFLKDFPLHQPLIEPPSSLPRSGTPRITWDRQTGNSIHQVVIGRKEDPLMAFYFDVDREPVAKISDQQAAQLNEEDFWRSLGVDWCVTWNPTPTYFFDRDLDGKYDIVFVVDGGFGDDVCKLELTEGQWKASRADTNFLDSDAGEIVFERSDAQNRYKLLRHRMLPSILRR